MELGHSSQRGISPQALDSEQQELRRVAQGSLGLPVSVTVRPPRRPVCLLPIHTDRADGAQGVSPRLAMVPKESGTCPSPRELTWVSVSHLRQVRLREEVGAWGREGGA